MCKSMNIGFQFQLHSLDDYRILGKILPGGFFRRATSVLAGGLSVLMAWRDESRGVFFTAILCDASKRDDDRYDPNLRVSESRRRGFGPFVENLR